MSTVKTFYHENSSVRVESRRDEVLEDLEKAVAKAMEEIGLQAQNNATLEINRAVYDTPESPSYVRTGRLRASITYATHNGQGRAGKEAQAGDYKTHSTPEEFAVYVGTNVEYAPFVELGTVRMNPRPYLRPCIANYLDQYKEIIRKNLEDA